MLFPGKEKDVWRISLLLSVLIAAVSITGISNPGIYNAETHDWKMQAMGQDYIDLFLVVPVLLFTGFFVYRKARDAFLVWGGVIIYILYTFIIYCFSVHFNTLFVVYCLILGISFYKFLWFLYIISSAEVPEIMLPAGFMKFTGIYFIVLAILFYFLWLSEILPALIYNKIPENLTETGLVTNPVHVIDLSVMLPAMFLTGFFILKGKQVAIRMVPAFLIFFILMDITIAVLNIYMTADKDIQGFAVAVAMIVLAVFSGILLYMFNRKVTVLSIIKNGGYGLFK